jgi:hypothetical protein
LFTSNDAVTAFYDFSRFGNGARKSDFYVTVEWKDIEALIDGFSGGGHPMAVALKDALRLAAAAQELGWSSPNHPLPQSN